MEVALAFITGLLIRLGIPIAITVVALIFLHRLDKNWKKEALTLPVAPSGKRCWEVKGCSEEQKQKCPVYARPKEPCWHVFRNKDGVMKETCLGCVVFRRAPVLIE